jgi:hypothetical protein
MQMTRFLLSVSALALTTATAAALPIAPLSPATPAAVELVNGNHSSCNRGPAGWHYHYRGERIACGGRPSGRYWGWTNREGRWGWWNSRERRWN